MLKRLPNTTTNGLESIAPLTKYHPLCVLTAKGHVIKDERGKTNPLQGR